MAKPSAPAAVLIPFLVILPVVIIVAIIHQRTQRRHEAARLLLEDRYCLPESVDY